MIKFKFKNRRHTVEFSDDVLGLREPFRAAGSDIFQLPLWVKRQEVEEQGKTGKNRERDQDKVATQEISMDAAIVAL